MTPTTHGQHGRPADLKADNAGALPDLNFTNRRNGRGEGASDIDPLVSGVLDAPDLDDARTRHDLARGVLLFLTGGGGGGG